MKNIIEVPSLETIVLFYLKNSPTENHDQDKLEVTNVSTFIEEDFNYDLDKHTETAYPSEILLKYDLEVSSLIDGETRRRKFCKLSLPYHDVSMFYLLNYSTLGVV